MPGIGIGIGLGTGKVPPLPPEIKFDLLENGLDFITEAVEILKADKNNRKLKYSVIHLCSGIELIFKEVIRNKDWRLLFQNKKDASLIRLRSGDFESIRYNKLIELLESKCDIKFSYDEKGNLNKLRIKRNKIEHFKVRERISEIRSMISDALNIVIHFINTHIDLGQASLLSRKYMKNLSTYNKR